MAINYNKFSITLIAIVIAPLVDVAKSLDFIEFDCIQLGEVNKFLGNYRLK